ncbi:MAG: hypothetical protein WCP15_00975 [bacterium]
MKNINKSLIIVSVFLLITVISLINLLKSKKYDVQIKNDFSEVSASTTITCVFNESSTFYKVKGQNFISHTAGMESNKKSTTLTFIDIHSDNPKVDYNTKLKDGSEMISKLTAKKISNYILMTDTSSGELITYTIFPSQNTAVWQQTTTIGQNREIAGSFNSMGFCH